MVKVEAPEPQILYVKARQKQAKKARKTRTRQPDPEDMVRAVCTGKLRPVRAREADPMRKAYQMANHYADLFARYYKRQRMNMRTRLEEKSGVATCFMRAVAQAEMLCAPFGDYMAAQFHWITDYHGRPPHYSEICSAPAIVRYRRWQELKAGGDEPAFQVHPAILGGGVRDPRETPSEVVMKYEQDVLTRMIKQVGSEREVWLLCGEPGNNEVFTDGFKETRPVWRSIYKEDQ